MKNVTVLDHPLIEHKLSILRDKHTGTKLFRELVGEIGAYLVYEAMRDVPLEETVVETPIKTIKMGRLNEDNYAFAPIMRAGMGLLDGVLKVIPNAKIAHVGMYRDEETFEPVNYFFKAPEDIGEREVIILRFGLRDGHPRTLEEVGKEFKVTRERIRQIEAKALRKLRNPVRSKKIKDFLNN